MALAVSHYPKKSPSVTDLISFGCGLGGVLFPILMQMVPVGKGFVMLSVSALAAAASITRVA